jgi:hypothetical protein
MESEEEEEEAVVENRALERLKQKQKVPRYQCFGSGSAFDLSPGSAFRMRIRIQQLVKLASKAKIKSYNLK